MMMTNINIEVDMNDVESVENYLTFSKHFCIFFFIPIKGYGLLYRFCSASNF